MVGEWNDGGANAQDHGWVDLAMCVISDGHVRRLLDTAVQIVRLWVIYLIPAAQLKMHLEVVWRHDNHCRFFLLGVKILDDTLLDKSFPAVDHRASLLVAHAGCLNPLVLLQLLNVLAVEDQPAELRRLRPDISLDNKQRTHDSAGVGKDFDLPLSNIADDADLERYIVLKSHTSPKLGDLSREYTRVPVHADPDTVDKDFGGIWRG